MALRNRSCITLVALALAVAVAACGGGGGSAGGSGGTTAAIRYGVGGTVSGLDGTVVLQDNEGDDLTLTHDGAFTFATSIVDGGAYAVTVKAQPAGQRCDVANGSGTIAGAAVSNVAVTCVSQYRIGGTVAGLAGTLVLQDNAADDLTLTHDGAFTFATSVARGGSYAVTVKSQPPAQRCTVANGSGTNVQADVANVQVTCVSYYRVGGTVSGLGGTGLVLQNNLADDLAISHDGAFTFATSVANGGAYHVTVKTQPTPQSCTVANASGNVAGADVAGVAVTCQGWDPAQLVTASGDARFPRFGFAPGGDAVAVWWDGAGTTTTASYGSVIPEVRTARYSRSSRTWGAAQRLDGAMQVTSLTDTPPADVAVDGLGNAMAVWRQWDSIYSPIFLYARRQPAGGAWDPPLLVTGMVENPGSPRVAMDATGHAEVVWAFSRQANTTAGNAWARGWSPQAQWSGWTALDTDAAGARDPLVAFDGAGAAFAVWWDGFSATSLAVSRKPAGGSWSPVRMLEATPHLYSAGKDLAVSANGDAMVVFAQPESSYGTRAMWARRYDHVAGTWEDATLLEPASATTDVRSPTVAMDAFGHAVAVWGLASSSTIHARRFDPGTGSWGALEVIDSGGYSYSDRAISVAMDPATGDIIVVWTHGTYYTSADLYATRAVAGGAFAAPVPLENLTGPVYEPLVRIDENGNSLVVWSQAVSGKYRVFSTSFR